MVPKKVLKALTRFTRFNGPRQAPAITSLWPPMNFVAE
jgi:hypothetical protein